MNRLRALQRIVILAVTLLSITVGTAAQVTLGDFERALGAMPLEDPARILAAIESGLQQPSFPAQSLLGLIERLAPIPGPVEAKEMALLLITRASENGMPIDGLVSTGFQVAIALEDGLPVEGILLEALKGIAQGTPVSVIEAGLTRRLTLLREVQDLLLAKGISRAPPGSTPTSSTMLPAARFDELVNQIADTLSDHLEGGGGPFDGSPPGQALYDLVADRLNRLPESLVHATDVQLVLGLIQPADLTQIALAVLT